MLTHSELLFRREDSGRLGLSESDGNSMIVPESAEACSCDDSFDCLNHTLVFPSRRHTEDEFDVFVLPCRKETGYCVFHMAIEPTKEVLEPTLRIFKSRHGILSRIF